MKKLLEFCLVYLFVNCVYGDKSDFRNLMRFLARNSSMPHYRPNLESATPTYVGLNMHVIGFHTVNEENGQMRLDCYLRTYWNAPSLIFPNTTNYEKIHLNIDNSARYIWNPDVFLVEARETQQHATIKEDGFIKIEKNGDVTRSAKMSFTFSCPFDFSSFPFDTQKCPLHFESYGGTTDDIKLAWHSSVPFTIGYNFLDQKNAFQYSFSKPGTERSETPIAVYERLEVEITLKRQASHYIVIYFLPTTLLVILGGLMFWIPLSSLHERTFYGAFLFLTSAIFVTSCQFATPSVGYLKAIDVWCVACMIFLFVAPLEVIILQILRTKYSQHSTRTFHEMKDQENNKTGDLMDTPSDAASAFFRGGKILPYIDLALKVAYPVAFLIFIIAYASIYH